MHRCTKVLQASSKLLNSTLRVDILLICSLTICEYAVSYAVVTLLLLTKLEGCHMENLEIFLVDVPMGPNTNFGRFPRDILHPLGLMPNCSYSQHYACAL